MALPPNHIKKETVEDVYRQVPGLLSKLKNS